MNSESIYINERYLEDAKNACNSIDDNSCRCKATASVFAANIAREFFKDRVIDTNSGIHNVPSILQDIEISDIYVQNSFIDVRLYFDDNDLCVPKDMFEKNVLPVAFMFIKLNNELSSAIVTGFITPADVDTDNELSGYYKVDENKLLSFYDIEPLLTNIEDSEISEEMEADIYEFLDNKLNDKNNFYRELIQSKELRLLLIKAYEAQIKYTEIAKSITAQSDNNIISSNIQDDLDKINEFSNETEDIEPTDIAELEEIPFDSELSLVNESNIDTLSEFNEIESENFEIDNNFEKISIDDDTLINEEFVEIKDDNIEETQINDNLESFNFNEEFNNNEGTTEVNNVEPVKIEDYTSDIGEENNTDKIQSYEEIELSEQINDEIPVDEIPESTDNKTFDLLTDLDVLSNEQHNDTTTYNEEVETPEYTTETTPSLNSYSEEEGKEEDESIDELFTQGGNTEAEEQIETSFQSKPKKKLIIPILGLIVILAIAGNFAFNKFHNTIPTNDTILNNKEDINIPAKKAEDAMPLESIENVAKDKSQSEGTSVSIPGIENNLDASVLVSNLSVNWEVPSGYLTNNSAKRYFTKIGKIIQLNLKTELLLLSKPPINNRIVLELEYNKASHKFDIKGFATESGEKSIDDLIKRTVTNVLDMNLNINISSFGNVQGNPMLVIKL